MTEQEWLVSSDPQAMLLHLTAEMVGTSASYVYASRPGGRGPVHQTRKTPLASDRKLRLFACACRRAVGTFEWASSGGWGYMEEHPDAPVINSADSTLAIPAIEHARLFLSEHLRPQDKPAPQVAADLLRDVVGNPHRPVTLWPSRCPRCDSPDPARHPAMQWEGEVQPCHDDWHNHTRCPWLTPLVVSLAEAAYAERPGRVCVHCKGTGKEMAYPEAYDDPPAHPITCRWGCDNGRIEDGQLDPARLAVLADALEEAGCPTDACVACGGFIKPHPLLAHLRSPGPHVRGCHAVDLCLGKS